MSMITPSEVIEITGVKPQTFRLEKDDVQGLESLLTNWIIQSEGLITSYCNNQFNDEIPPAVKNVCLRLTANMVAFSQSRNNTPVVKVNEWTVQTVSSKIFSNDLKQDLEPFRIERKSRKSDKIDFFTIVGD